MAIDGVQLDIPENAGNLAECPTAVGGTHRPYPWVKIVGLGECGTHALIDAQIGSTRVGERELAEPLTRSREPDMLVTADRGFFSCELWRTYLLAGAQQGAVEPLRGLRPALTRHHREQVVLRSPRASG